MDFPVCERCGGTGTVYLPKGPDSSGACPACGGDGVIMTEQDRQALAEDERDMQQIANEWDAYDHDPPGS